MSARIFVDARRSGVRSGSGGVDIFDKIFEFFTSHSLTPAPIFEVLNVSTWARKTKREYLPHHVYDIKLGVHFQGLEDCREVNRILLQSRQRYVLPFTLYSSSLFYMMTSFEPYGTGRAVKGCSSWRTRIVKCVDRVCCCRCLELVLLKNPFLEKSCYFDCVSHCLLAR